MLPGNFEILHALKVCSGGFLGSFLRTHTGHTYTASCRLRLAVSVEICISSINAKQKSRLSWNQQYSEMNPLEKLDWYVNEWWTRSYLKHCLVAPLNLGPGTNWPCCPPLAALASCREMFVHTTHIAQIETEITPSCVECIPNFKLCIAKLPGGTHT